MKKHSVTLITLFLVIAAYFTATMPFDSRYSLISSITVVLFALPSFYFICRMLPLKQGLLLILGLSVFAIALESLAVKTRFPYGSFSYTDKIGYKVLGLVPWTVPFAWVPLVLGTYALADRFVDIDWAKIVLSAMLLVLVDMVLDPGAVALKFWIWKGAGDFYGVPTSNFFGWLVSGFIGSYIIYRVVKNSLIGKSIKGVLSSLYFILIFWTSVGFFKQLWLPGMIGLGLIIFMYFNSRNVDPAKAV